MYFNADSLLNKINELKMMIGEENPLVIGVNEMVPKNYKLQTQEVELGVENYKCFVNLMTNAEGVESVWCEVKMMGKDKLLIGCIYRSPNSNAINDARINATLKKANNLGFSHVLIFIDLNHPCLNWCDNTSPTDENHPATLFMEAVRDSFLTQHVIEPTHYRGSNTPNTRFDLHQGGGHDRQAEVPGSSKKKSSHATEVNVQLLLLHKVNQI